MELEITEQQEKKIRIEEPEQFSYFPTSSAINEVKEEIKEAIKVADIEPTTENYFKGDTSFMIDKVEYSEPTEYEIKMLEGTRNAEQQLEAEKTEEQPTYDLKKVIIDMVKVLALVENGHSPIDNPSLMYNTEKQKIITSMGNILNLDYETIKAKFNEVCNEKLFTPACDFSSLPVIYNH